MPEYRDQLGRVISLSERPSRVISLVPSQTEFLYDLGLEEEILGITKFCIKPEAWFRNKTRVGGTKALDLEKINTLKPDLIIANKEENDQSQIEALWNQYPVWVSDIYTLEDAREMMQIIGKIFGADQRAESIIAGTSNLNRPTTQLEALYLIWNEPYMAAGKNTFINTMMDIAGFKNLTDEESRYPEYTLGDIQKLQPDVLLLSSEPFPFKKIHQSYLQQSLPHTKVILVDGEMFSWYGSRLTKAQAYFDQLRAEISC